MKNRLSLALVLGLAALLAGCQGPCDKIEPITGPALTGGSADFTTYVSLGTSISSGWQSGGLVDRHQVNSFPAIFARQIGKTVLQSGTGEFSLPTVGADGFPPLLELRSLSPLVVSNSGRTFGSSTNAAWPTAYHNMAVPFSILLDAVDTTNYYATVAPPAGIGRPATQFFFFENTARHRGTILGQALSLAPTFMSIELGANELLGYATSGGTSSIFPTATWAAILTQAVNSIHTARPNTKVALFSVPEPTSIPFFKTFVPGTIRLSDGVQVPLLGPDGALSATDLVLLTAKDSLAIGTGFAVGSYNYVNPTAPGNGRPLLNSQVLNTTEQQAISTAWTGMNAAVDSVSSRPFVVEVDLSGLLVDVAANGLQLGSTHYTTSYITGGLFSLDGVHPNSLAHALAANHMIDAVNAKFGSTISRVNMSQYATPTSSRSRPAIGESPAGPGLEGLTIEGLDERALGVFRSPR